MASPASTPERLRPRQRFLGLLLALWALLILPNLPHRPDLRWLAWLTAGAFVLLLARTLAFDNRLSTVGRASLWGLTAAIVLREGANLERGTEFFWIALLLELLAVGGVTSEVLRYLALPAVVDRDRLLAAACGYLLIGFQFACLFELVAQIEPHGMSAPLGDRVAYRYFSFVTLSTLGYGDVVPVTPICQMLAVSEALIGQLYLAMVVALLVGRIGARMGDH